MVKNTIGYKYNEGKGHNEISFEEGKNLLFVDHMNRETKLIDEARENIIKHIKDAETASFEEKPFKTSSGNLALLAEAKAKPRKNIDFANEMHKDYGPERMQFIEFDVRGNILNRGIINKESWETSLFYEVLKDKNMENLYNNFVVASIDYDDDDEFTQFKTDLVKHGVTIDGVELVELCVGGNQGKKAKSLLVPKQAAPILRKAMLGSMPRNNGNLKAGLTWMKENANIAYGLNVGILIDF